MYNDEQIKAIEQMAAMFLTISDMAVILEVNAPNLKTAIADKNSPAGIAYRRGKLTTKMALHRQELQLAQIGSPAAIENMRNYLLEMEEDE